MVVKRRRRQANQGTRFCDKDGTEGQIQVSSSYCKADSELGRVTCLWRPRSKRLLSRSLRLHRIDTGDPPSRSTLEHGLRRTQIHPSGS